MDETTRDNDDFVRFLYFIQGLVSEATSSDYLIYWKRKLNKIKNRIMSMKSMMMMNCMRTMRMVMMQILVLVCT